MKAPGLDELEALRVRLDAWTDGDLLGGRAHLRDLASEGIAAIRRQRVAELEALLGDLGMPDPDAPVPYTLTELGRAAVAARKGGG